MAASTTESHHLRALILKIQDYLTDQDRQRLHFFLGPDVPRRIRDDTSLTGTLNLIESLIEQDKINEQDFTFLISAFEAIQCHDAVKILKDHMKQMQNKGQSETLQRISSMLLEEQQDDKYARETFYPVVDIRTNNDPDKEGNRTTDTPTIQPMNMDVSETPSQVKPNRLMTMIKLVLMIFALFAAMGLVIATIVIGTQNTKLKKEILVKETNLVDEQQMIKNYSEMITKLKHQIVSLKQTTVLSNISQIPDGIRVMRNGVTVAGGNGKGDRLDQLFSPLFMTVDDDQTIYISDQGNSRIVAWKKNATLGEVVAGGNDKGARNDQLNYPRAVLIDRERDALIIADYENRRVIRWPRRNGTSGETIIADVGCLGLAWDSLGYLYVSDWLKHEVRRWKIGENEGVLVAGGNGQGTNLNQFNGPRHIYVDQNETIYISDNGNNRVMKWTKGAKQGSIAAGGYGTGNGLRQLYFPNGLVVDQSGTLYVADFDNDRVMRWLKDAVEGEVFVGANGKGNQADQLNGPVDLAFDQQNNLYVLEYGGSRVQKFSSDQFL